MLFILFSISRGLENWLVNHTSIYENSELNVFTSIKFLRDISNNWPNDLLEIQVYKTLVYRLIIIANNIKWTDITSVNSKWGTVFVFSYLTFKASK